MQHFATPHYLKMSGKPLDLASLYDKHADLKPEDVELLKEWLRKQPHLPQITDYKLALFLSRRRHSVEATKKLIEDYHVIRTLCPETCTNRDPTLPKIRLQMDVNLITYLPDRTEEGYDVGFFRLMDIDADKFSYFETLKVFDALMSVFLLEKGVNTGLIVIIDTEGLTMGHVAKIDLSLFRKYAYFLQEASLLRPKALHFVNVSPLTDVLLKLCKPVLKKKLREAIHLHQTPTKLHDFIPKDILPNEYGGRAGSFKELQEQTRKKLLDNAEFLLEEDGCLVDETKRLGEAPNDVYRLFGTVGTFKTIEID